MGELPNLLLSMVVWIPGLGALIALLLPERTPDQRGRIRLVGLAGSGLSLLLVALATYARIGEGEAGGGLNGALVERHDWIQAFPITAGYHLDADGLSLPLLLLSTGVFTGVMLASWKNHHRVRSHTVLLLALEVAVNGVLSAQDYLLVLLFWGLQLLPLQLLVAGWGGEARRRAAARLVGVSLTSMGLLITAVLLMVTIAVRAHHPSFDLADVNAQKLETLAPGLAAAAFWSSLAGFALAMAAFPVHRWLVMVCAEASPGVAAAVVGAVVPLGGYGMLRVMLGAFPALAHQNSLVLAGLAAATAAWGALAGTVQDSLRRRLAYACVAQLSGVLLAAGTQTSLALQGAVLLLLSNGLAFAMLLLLGGAIEERGRTSLLSRLGGLAWQAPRLGWLWLFASLAAVGAPLLAGFSAELVLFTGAFPAHRLATVVVIGSLLLTTATLLHTVQRIFFGPAREAFARVGDVGPLELAQVTPLMTGILFFGLLPRSIMPVISAGISPIARRIAGG